MGNSTSIKNRRSFNNYPDYGIGPASASARGGVFNPNPLPVKKPEFNPKKYEILDSAEIGRYLVVKVKFTQSVKVLIYEDLGLEDLEKQGIIDPNFSQNKTYRTPMASFEPTIGGWHIALKLCNFIRHEQMSLGV